MSQLFVDDVVSKEGTNSVGFSKGVNVSASSTITGNLNVSGVLTYEDVTNVDSVGIVTARGGIKIGAAGIGGTIAANGKVARNTKRAISERSKQIEMAKSTRRRHAKKTSGYKVFATPNREKGEGNRATWEKTREGYVAKTKKDVRKNALKEENIQHLLKKN